MPPEPPRDKNWKLLYRQAVQRARAPGPTPFAEAEEPPPRLPARDRANQPALRAEERLNVLFICSRNQWRSPTAEKIWRNNPQLSVRSAGTSPHARHHVTDQDLHWAQAIFVMEEKHKTRLLAEFGRILEHKPIHVLDIPDEYQYMDPALVVELERSVGAILGIGDSAAQTTSPSPCASAQDIRPLNNPKHYLVIDFEATCCDRGSVPRAHMEIIEFGAVMVDAASLQIESEFQSFVRPVRHPKLTAFCTELTSITQHDVDSAPEFAAAVDAFKLWLYQYEEFVFCSWGDYDLHQLRQDCDYHGVPYPIRAGHVNVKRLMAERQGLAKKPGLGDAVRRAGLKFAGTHHRGIDDARNIARLLPYVFGDQVLTGG